MTRLLLVAAALVVWIAAAGVGAGAEWDVYPGGSIQDAIDGAEAGDTIYVHAGTYVENVDVDKQLTLIGDGADVVTVRAADAGGHVLEVTADYVNILGFNVTGATGVEKAGSYLNGRQHCNISRNTADSNSYGIRLSSSSNNNLVYHNNLINNERNAYDTGTNQWDSGAEGNYWSDYTGTDTNRDGIGDDPYDIPGGVSTDRYPLMHPWSDTPPQKGDLNRDGILTPADAAIALEIAAGGSASCDAAAIAAADVSGDHRVTSLDALMILQAAGGAIEL